MIRRIIVYILACILMALLCASNVKAQSITTEKVMLGLNDESLGLGLKKIEDKTTFRFYYRESDIAPFAHLNLPEATRTLSQTLDILLKGSTLSYRQMDNHILIEPENRRGLYQIKGRIINAADKIPVANATVFINNATGGATTKSDGSFVLSNLRPGKYELVVSVVGFEAYLQQVNIDDHDIELPPVQLLPKTVLLNEVKIKPVEDPNWDFHYAWFKKQFLGLSDLGYQCKIINPGVLNLSSNDKGNILTASSDGFLQIENDALGYQIKYLLNDFTSEYNGLHQKLHFKGSAFFEEMKGSPAQQRRWQRARLDAYQGSMMHFLRSALNNTFAEEGFRVLRIDTEKVYAADSSERKVLTLSQTPLSQQDIVSVTDQKGIYALRGKPGGLYVNYSKNHRYGTADKLADVDYPPGNSHKSIIAFKASYQLFDRNGCITNTDDVPLTGAWANDRVGDLLPVDYYPEQQNSATYDKLLVDEGPAVLGTVSTPLKDKVLMLKEVSDSVSNADASEKPYLQFDKPYYTLGDTIWYKAYLMNANSLLPSDKSAILYIDIADDSSKIVKRYSIQMNQGLGWGNIALNEKDFHEGNYTLRAYTAWMENSGQDYFFYKDFSITGGENTLLVNRQAEVTNGATASANVKLRFTDLYGKPDVSDPLTLRVFSGNKNLYKQVVTTDKNGQTDFNIGLPAKHDNLTITAENQSGNRKAIIPINQTQPENTDVQFLPESGSLVAGLPAHVGFKAIGEDGRGINISGIMVDNDQKQVASFTSLHNGIGSFAFIANEGERYVAKVTLPGGIIKDYPLPAVAPSGTVMQVKILPANDSLEVYLAATNDWAQPHNSYFLIGKARGVVCYAAVINFAGENLIKRWMAKSLFPAGIVHFTLMTMKGEPLNERLVFIKRDGLHIRLNTENTRYNVKDSVALNVKVTDDKGAPVAGNFSMSVTDDPEVKIDSVDNDNIASRLLLTADLKGYVEQPGYYFESNSPEAQQALDNLMITQGWVGYNWHDVFYPAVPKYPAENQFMVQGHVLNVFSKAVKDTHIFLFSVTPRMLIDTVTDSNGKFVFDRLPQVDTPVFVLKAVNKKGESYNVRVLVDELQPPAFLKPASPATGPWYVNSDSTLIRYTKNNIMQRQLAYYKATGHLLKEVKITSKKIIKGSQNLNGPGNADLVLDEKDMEAAGKKNWLQVLKENIQGFRPGYGTKRSSVTLTQGPLSTTRVVGYATNGWYYIKFRKARIIIDGVELTPELVSVLSDTQTPRDIVNELEHYLTNRTAEEIRGIELNYSSKYNDRYGNKFGPVMTFVDDAFIEITTRSGHGPYGDYTPGMYLFRPLALSIPKQFYKPKYAVKDTARQPTELRSTIDWEPNIFTGRDGNASVSFNAGDKPSAYTVVIEGTDMNGGFAYGTAHINVGAAVQPPAETGMKGK